MARPEHSPNIMVSDNYDIIGVGSVYGIQEITSVPTPLKVGVDELQQRTSMFVNVVAGTVLLGLDEQLSKNKYFLLLSAGERVQLTLANNTEIPIYAMAYSGFAKVALLESIS